MTERPEWAMYVHYYLTDSILAYMPDDGEDDMLLDDVIDAANAVLCGHYGHEIVDDQCNKPEHRYCAYCGKRESDL